MPKNATTAQRWATESGAVTTSGRAGYTPVEVAAMLAISRAKLYELLSSGELASFTIGRSRRIPAAAVDAFVTAKLAEAAQQKAAG